jgi:hypothetical protein
VYFLAGLCSFLFLREVGCRELAAVVAAAGWMFCQFMLFWTGWPHTLTVAVLPLVLLASRRLARSPGIPSAGLLTVVLTLLLLGGHPESMLHVAAVGVVYGLCELGVHLSRLGRAERSRAVVCCLCAGIAAGAVAISLAAVELLPFVDALQQTHEIELRTSQGHRVAHSVPWKEATERLRIMAAPFAYGTPLGGRVPGAKERFGPWWSPYIGSVLFAPLLFGLWRGRWRGRWLMLVLILLGTLAYVGAPFPNQILARIPPFEMAINRRLGFAVAFAAVAVAALGVEAWIRNPRDRSLGLLTLAVAGIQGMLIAAFWPGLRDVGLESEFLVTQTLLELVPVVLLGGVLLAVRSPRIGVAALLLALLVQRSLQAGPMNPTYPETVFYPQVPLLNELPTTDEPYRVTGLDSALRPNLAAMYQLEDVRGYQAMRNQRLFATYPLWVGPEGRHSQNAQISDLSRPFLSFLNVRYAVVADTKKAPRKWREVAEDRGAALYENPHVVGRAFVPERVRTGVSPEQAVREMAGRKNFSRLSWVEDAPSPKTARKPRTRGNGPGRVRSTRVARGLHMEVEMDGPGWVVVSQTAWSGWRASADGRELTLRFANVAFLAFHLSAGRHSVDLEYLPRAFVIGRSVTLTMLGLLTILVVLGVARRRRSGARFGRGKRTDP